jgi:hypothetical protein
MKGVGLTALLWLAPGSRAAETPLQVEIEPNAIVPLGPGRPPRLTIDVQGVPEGGTVWLAVVRDCDGNGQPERPADARETCPALIERESVSASRHRRVQDHLNAESLNELPRGEVLWLRVTRSRDTAIAPSPVAALIRFALVENACALWPTVIATFFGGKCSPGLLQALRRHRGPSGLDERTFEVRFASVGLSPNHSVVLGPSLAVEGTRDATGAAWESTDSLLVTRGKSAPGRTMRPSAAELARVRLGAEKTTHEQLWTPPDGNLLVPAAPLPLDRGQVAFAIQSQVGEPAPGKPAARIVRWNGSRIDAEVEVPFRIHQMMAYANGGQRVLALSLGTDANRPVFLDVDFASRTFEIIGYDNVLYQAAQRSPTSGVSAIAFEDNSGKNGWEILLVGEDGQWIGDIARGTGDELLPAWRADSKALLWLAEVDR